MEVLFFIICRDYFNFIRLIQKFGATNPPGTVKNKSININEKNILF